jgi:hypothetical protein
VDWALGENSVCWEGTQGSLGPGSVGRVPGNSTPVISEGLQRLSLGLVQSE